MFACAVKERSPSCGDLYFLADAIGVIGPLCRSLASKSQGRSGGGEGWRQGGHGWPARAHAVFFGPSPGAVHV